MLGLRMPEALSAGHHGVSHAALSHPDAPARHPEQREGSVVGRRSNSPAKSAREAAKTQGASWTPPVLRSVAIKSEGTADILAALDRHALYLTESGTLTARRRKRLRERVVEIVERTISGRLWNDASTNAWIESRIGDLESGKTNPFSTAQELVARSGDLMTGRAE
jgi:LAO/AO transport system kinase